MNALRDAPGDDSPVPGPVLTAPRLSATLAHEMNNIAASLRGFIELGEELAGGNRPLQDIFAELRQAAVRSAALAGDLETLAARAGPGISTGVLALLRGLAGVPADAEDRQCTPSASPPSSARPPLHCVGCGADCAAGQTWIHQALPAGHSALLVAPTPEATVLTAAQLRLAILVEVAHRAGWHTVINTDLDWLALARADP